MLEFLICRKGTLPSSTNRLIDSLSLHTREQLIALSTPVTLSGHKAISKAGRRPDYAYLPLSGAVSELITLDNGQSVEVGVVGREGITGCYHLLGPAPSKASTFVQVDGEAYSIPYAALLELFLHNPEVHARVLHYLQHQMAHLRQNAACNRHHDAAPRLARWLLTLQDRSSETTFHLTHEHLARMLGTGRPTITLAMKQLEDRELVEQGRGRVRIMHRTGLKQVACFCYGVTQRALKKLYSH